MSSGKSMSDFFARKKKKAPKTTNLNDESAAAPAAATGSKDKKGNWKEDDKDAEEAVSPKQRAVQNLATLPDEDEKAAKSAKTWLSAPKAGTGPGAGARYAPPVNQPGTITDRKFPTLGTGIISSAVEAKPADRARVNVATNAFANLQVQDDSDDEDERLLKPALVSKEKGVRVHATKKHEPEEEESESKRKEREEKERRKREREEQKKEDRQKKEEEEKQLAKEKAAREEAAKAAITKCDTSKFQYGLFDLVECQTKYEKRTKMPVLDIPVLALI